MPVTFTNTWSAANAYCNNTAINGQSGWRLPKMDELSALYKSGATKDHGWSLDYTWSATPNSAGDHYFVSLVTGRLGAIYYTGAVYVTCVR
jgi:hypothetical protein